MSGFFGSISKSNCVADVFYGADYHSHFASHLDLASRKAVKQLEDKDEVDIKVYSDTNNGKYRVMVEQIRKNLGFTTPDYQRLDDLVDAIGLPKEELCTPISR